jgi:6-phosphogluconolactonase
MSSADARVRLLSGELVVRETSEAWAEAAAEVIERASDSAIAARGSFAIALNGGSTPLPLYKTLRRSPWRESIRWAAWRVFFGDERACPPDDERSNYHMVRTTLLDHVPIAPGHVHRMPADSADLDAAAREYAALLERELPRGPAGAPRLDCILLGLGENGHTASLFPDTPALDVRDRWVTRGRADYPPYDRITLTFPTLNAAALVAFLVTGASKRAALGATAAGEAPAARVHPGDGELVWLLDSAAGGPDSVSAARRRWPRTAGAARSGFPAPGTRNRARENRGSTRPAGG